MKLISESVRPSENTSCYPSLFSALYVLMAARGKLLSMFWTNIDTACIVAIDLSTKSNGPLIFSENETAQRAVLEGDSNFLFRR